MTDLTIESIVLFCEFTLYSPLRLQLTHYRANHNNYNVSTVKCRNSPPPTLSSDVPKWQKTSVFHTLLYIILCIQTLYHILCNVRVAAGSSNMQRRPTLTVDLVNIGTVL